MISHVVLMKPRPDLPAAEREALVSAFETAIRQIPAIRSVRVGKRVTHGASYETAVPDAADYLIVLDFDDLAALRTYLEHPAHEELGARFNQSLRAGLVYDFEVRGPEALRTGWLFPA